MQWSPQQYCWRQPCHWQVRRGRSILYLCKTRQLQFPILSNKKKDKKLTEVTGWIHSGPLLVGGTEPGSISDECGTLHTGVGGEGTIQQAIAETDVSVLREHETPTGNTYGATQSRGQKKGRRSGAHFTCINQTCYRKQVIQS